MAGADLLSGFRRVRAGDRGLRAAPWAPASLFPVAGKLVAGVSL